MNKERILAQMRAVTNAVYLREHAKVKPILDHEARLRGQLEMLKQQVQDNKEVAADSHEIKALGADLQWETWHMQARKNLNHDIAQATSRKLFAMEQLRGAFGKKHAVEAMEEEHRLDRREKRNKSQFNRLMDLD